MTSTDSQLVKARLMSNAKWRKLFTIIDDSEINVAISMWKFLDESRVYEWTGLPGRAHLLDERLEDGRWQPVFYKDIEYVEIPAKCKNTKADLKRQLPNIDQQVLELYRVIEARGRFPIAVTKTGIRIHGYQI